METMTCFHHPALGLATLLLLLTLWGGLAGCDISPVPNPTAEAGVSGEDGESPLANTGAGQDESSDAIEVEPDATEDADADGSEEASEDDNYDPIDAPGTSMDTVGDSS